MADDPKTDADFSNTKKDPKDWLTGDEPMTGAQASYLKTLCEEMGETFDPGLTKAAAFALIARSAPATPASPPPPTTPTCLEPGRRPGGSLMTRP